MKQLSLSVLVDHTLRWEGPAQATRIVEPPSAEKLKVIHDLVAAATGSRHRSRRSAGGGGVSRSNRR